VVPAVPPVRLMSARPRGGAAERAACATAHVLGYPVCHRARKAGEGAAPM